MSSLSPDSTSGQQPLPAQVPVLILGGGPNGMSMALFLARLGVRCLLIERRTATSSLPRATQISRRTVELFREAGLERAMCESGLVVVPPDDPRTVSEPTRFLPRNLVAVRSLADFASAEVLDNGDEELSLASPCPPLWCGQDRFEPVLRRAAIASGADLRFGHELTEWETRGPVVLARVRSLASGQDYLVRSRFLIAADGARGATAERLGVSRAGLGLVAQRLSILFRADLTRVLAGRRFFISMIENDEFSGSVMPLNEPDRWAAAVEREACPEPGSAPTGRHLELVRAAIGDQAAAATVEAIFPWRAEHGVADQYRSGPVFLLGDAAHLNPPAGGYGFNVGFQDAHNLAWKIAARIAGWGGDRLLDTYQAERRPVAAATAEQALLFDGVPPERLGGAQRCDSRYVIACYRYSSAAVAGGEGRDGGPFGGSLDLTGEPGTLVPHAWLPGREVGGGPGVSTLDLCGPGFTLLSAEPSWLAAADRLSREQPVPLRACGLTDLDYARTCGFGCRGALLVRPDGFVAWRTSTVGRTEADGYARLSSVLADVVEAKAS